jgi:ribosomal protein S20
MSISPISAAGLGQSVLAASNSTQLQQTLRTLQNSLTSGDLNGAQTAFNTLQSLNQNPETVSGSNASSSSQLNTDLTALGSAISAGNLSTAQSAFTAVKSDLNNGNSPSLTNETAAATEVGQLVSQLLGSLNVNTSSDSSSPADITTSILERVYGSSGGLNVHA